MRLAVAGQRVVDEATVERVRDPAGTGLDERHRAALRLAEAVMTQPGAIDDDLVTELGRHLSADELVELTVDVMKWNYQKVAVALGTDAEISTGELSDLVFDADGNWVR